MRTIFLKAGIVAAIVLAPTALLGAPRETGRHDLGPAAFHSPATVTPVRSFSRGDMGGSRSFASPRTVGPRSFEPRAVQPRFDYGNRFYDGGRYGWGGDRNYRWSDGRWWYWTRGWLLWDAGRWIAAAVDTAVDGRYRWYDGNWWYWSPNNYWLYWDGSQWIAVGAGVSNNGY